MKHPYGIGLDIGIASVGWAVMALNENAEPYGLIRCGSRIFDAAEQPNTGESLAAPRREARSTRRRLRRRSLRKADLYELMAQNGLPGRAEIEEAVQAGHLPDIYALRVQALDGPVTAMDFARILLHLMQRRGFRSNRKADDAQKDGKLLQAIDANTRRMEENHYRTVGEMMYRDPVFAEHKRNKSENYLSTVRRDQIVEEAVQLFAAQRQYGAAWASPEMEAEYLTILTRQRSFAEGPGGDSPYRGMQKVGPCALEGKSERRAPKATFAFEYFTLLQKINHIRIAENGVNRILTAEERQELLSACYRTDKLDFARIRKLLALPVEARFNMVRYRENQTAEECEKKEKITVLPCYHKMRKVLNTLRKDHIRSISREQLDAAATALTNPENEEKLRAALEEAQFEPLEVDALMTLPSFSGFGHISVKACRKLIPYLEQGLNYNDACKEAGYDFQGNYRGEKSQFLPASTEEMEDITSPVVRRAVAQTIKVVNAIIREQGESPVNIHLELAREMSKNYKQRNELADAMEKNQAENARLMEELHDLFRGRTITGQTLVKYRLWKEQKEVCAYSLQMMKLDVRNEYFPEPWPRFRDELMQRLSACPQENLMQINPVYYQNVDIASIRPVFVSRMPRHKATGKVHEDTIRSYVSEGITAVRTSITDLKLDEKGEIEGYFNKESDLLLYNALKRRLEEFGGNAKKAFAEPFYKPRADGTPGAQVRKVKIVDKTSNVICVRDGGGVSKSNNMVRIDVYYVPGEGYYWVPIYVADTVKSTLPNKAVLRNKGMDDWKEMNEKDFQFSLYNNDLVFIERDSPISFSLTNKKSTLPSKFSTEKTFAYYQKGDISNAAIKVETPDGAYVFKSLTLNTVRKIEKYQVDVLGNYTLVKKEKRQNFPAQRR